MGHTRYNFEFGHDISVGYRHDDDDGRPVVMAQHTPTGAFVINSETHSYSMNQERAIEELTTKVRKRQGTQVTDTTFHVDVHQDTPLVIRCGDRWFRLIITKTGHLLRQLEPPS